MAPDVFHDQASTAYNVVLELVDSAGNVKSRQNVHNTVTTAGLAGLMDRLLASPTRGVPSHIAVGTGVPSGTALGLEVARVQLTSKIRTNNVVTMQGDWLAGVGTGALTEAGIFDSGSGGNMWLSVNFAVQNKLAADSLTIVWTFTVS